MYFFFKVSLLFSKAENIYHNNERKCNFFFVHFRETSAPLTAKIDSTNADLELKLDVNTKITLALIPRREQLESNSPVTKPCIGEKEWV